LAVISGQEGALPAHKPLVSSYSLLYSYRSGIDVDPDAIVRHAGDEMLRTVVIAAAAAALATPVCAADLYTAAYAPPISSPVYTPGPMVVGHLELGIGFANHTGGCDECNHDDALFVGAGRANLPLWGAWNLELETGGGAWFDSDDSDPSFGALGHLWKRLNSAAVGMFGGVNYPIYQLVEGTVGLEGEAYLGSFTLGASGSYNWGDGFDYWMAGAGADFYLTSESRLSGEASYYDGDFSGTSYTEWNARVIGEHHFAGTPLTGWAEASYTDYGDGLGHEWAGLAGVRVLMNTTTDTTLQQHDRDVPWDEIIGPRIYFQ
jgi:hypothetical protein